MNKLELFEKYLEERKQLQRLSNATEEVDLLVKICDLAKDIYGDKSNEYVYYLNELGGASKYVGRYDLGIKTLNLAKDIIQEKEGDESVPFATCLLNITEVYRFKGVLDNLEPLYLQVIDIYEKNNMQKEYVYAGVCNNIGLYYQNISNLEKAIYYHNKSLEILANMPEHIVEYATTFNNLVTPLSEIGDTNKAKEYVNKALKIYENSLGKHHSMYSAALNNLGIIKFKEGDYIASLNLFKDSLDIVKASFGESSVNYLNLLSNYENIEKIVKKNTKVEKVNVTKDDKLMDISREFTNKYILPLLEEKMPEVLEHVTIGLIGEGSEVLGYDDEFSRDHDFTFMPSILLKEENYNKYYDQLKDVLLSLPREFVGIKHEENPVVLERRGILKLEDYLFRFLGKDNANLSIADYRQIPEHLLLFLTSGQIFYSGDKTLENIREKLSYYPEIIRQNKIATVCTKIAQSGQYNYLRLAKRGDKIGANQAKSIFIENVIHLVYLLNKQYMPFYKWYARGLTNLDILGKDMAKRLEELIDNTSIDMYKMSNKIEEICYYLVEELKKQNLSKVKGYFMLNHGIFIQENIDDEFLKNWTAFED